MASSAAKTSQWAWSAGGRIGYAVTPQFLAYFSGGYTQANFNSVGFFTNIAGLPTTLSVGEQTYLGWFLGSGYEYGLNFVLPGLFWKTEYRFASYDRNNDRNAVLVTGPPGTHGDQLREVGADDPQRHSLAVQLWRLLGSATI